MEGGEFYLYFGGVLLFIVLISFIYDYIQQQSTPDSTEEFEEPKEITPVKEEKKEVQFTEIPSETIEETVDIEPVSISNEVLPAIAEDPYSSSAAPIEVDEKPKKRGRKKNI